MRIIEARMIRAIMKALVKADHAGRIMKCGNTEVKQNHYGVFSTANYQRTISVYLHGNEIAAIHPTDKLVWLSDCNWQTATTKSRLNAIISCLTSGCTIAQKDYQWLQGAERWEGEALLPLTINANNWQFKQVEKLAA